MKKKYKKIFIKFINIPLNYNRNIYFNKLILNIRKINIKFCNKKSNLIRN